MLLAAVASLGGGKVLPRVFSPWLEWGEAAPRRRDDAALEAAAADIVAGGATGGE